MTTSKPTAIPLRMLVLEIVRRTRMSGRIAARRMIVLIIAVTMVLVVEMVRWLRVSGIIVRWLGVSSVIATSWRMI
jgi:hypothetical protein